MWKRWEKALALAFILTLLFSAAELGVGLRTQNTMAQKMVRLHVLAASDSEYDQERKLQVKDAIFSRTEEILRSVADQQEAEQALSAALPELELLAEETLQRSGAIEEVTVSLVNERFNTRYYDGFTLPAGEYRSLQVIIGEGQGKNWWCVVFPPLCAASAEEFSCVASGAGLSENEIALIQQGEEGYYLRFRAVELWNRWMQRH